MIMQPFQRVSMNRKTNILTCIRNQCVRMQAIVVITKNARNLKKCVESTMHHNAANFGKTDPLKYVALHVRGILF